MEVLVIGKSGQLACELSRTRSADLSVNFLGRDELDIAKPLEVLAILGRHKPDIVINAAAYTAVDKAESEKDMAFAVNHLGCKAIADYCLNSACRLIHVSTDFVFDGTKSSPYEVFDPLAPLGVYGLSKLAGERAIVEKLESSVIVRTSWVYSVHGNNFVKTMLRLMSEKEHLGVVADQIGSPTWAKGLANWIWNIVKQPEVKGIYHWSDAGVASWYDFAVAIQEIAFELSLLKRVIPILPIKTSDYPTPAKRPSYSVLDKSAAEQASKLNTVHWRSQLREMLSDFKDQS